MDSSSQQNIASTRKQKVDDKKHKYDRTGVVLLG